MKIDSTIGYIFITALICLFFPAAVGAYTLNIGSGSLSGSERLLIGGTFNDNILRTFDETSAEGGLTTEFSSGLNINFAEEGRGGGVLTIHDEFDYTKLPSRFEDNDDFYTHTFSINGSRSFLSERLNIHFDDVLSHEPFDDTFLAHSNLVSATILNTRNPSINLEEGEGIGLTSGQDDFEIGNLSLQTQDERISINRFSVGFSFNHENILPQTEASISYIYHVTGYKDGRFSDSRLHDTSVGVGHMFGRGWSLGAGHTFSAEQQEAGRFEADSQIARQSLQISRSGSTFDDDTRQLENISTISINGRMTRKWDLSINYSRNANIVNTTSSTGIIRNSLGLESGWRLTKSINVDASIGYDKEMTDDKNGEAIGSLNFNWGESMELQWSLGATRNIQISQSGELFTTTRGNIGQTFASDLFGISSELFLVLDEVDGTADGHVLSGTLGTFLNLSGKSRVTVNGSASQAFDDIDNSRTTLQDASITYTQQLTSWVLCVVSASRQVFTENIAVEPVDSFRTNKYMFSFQGTFL